MNNLRYLRKYAGLSLAELHRMTGYPLRTLEMWDSNSRQITSYHRIKKLAKILKCGTDDLMTYQKDCYFKGMYCDLCMQQDEDGVHVIIYEKEEITIVHQVVIPREKALELLKYFKTSSDVDTFFNNI